MWFETRKRSLEEIQEIFGDEVVEGLSVDATEQTSHEGNEF
jgi:hypothetical protein